MMKKEIFDELKLIEEYSDDQITELFNDLFDNEDDNKKYVVAGSVGRWDGVRYGWKDKIYNSIASAINGAEEGCGMCYSKIYEAAYGRLILETMHHDGTNILEIRELTDYGEELDNNWYDVDYILNRHGATKNVKFYKNYM